MFHFAFFLSSSQGAYICTISIFIGATFSFIIIILSEISSHIITDFTTSSLTITPTPLRFLFLQSKIHGIYLLPHFLGAALRNPPLYPRMFLPLPLSQLPFFSFPLERLLAFLAYLSSERSTSLFCYSRFSSLYIHTIIYIYYLMSHIIIYNILHSKHYSQI